MRGAKGVPRAPRRTKRTAPVARECLMPKCSRKTTRPLGYCDPCWNKARRAS